MVSLRNIKAVKYLNIAHSGCLPDLENLENLETLENRIRDLENLENLSICEKS